MPQGLLKIIRKAAPVGCLALALAYSGLHGQDTWYSAYELALEKIAAGHWEEAIAPLELAVRLKPVPELNARTYGVWHRDYLPYFQLGLVYYNLGDNEKALENFKRSLAEGAIYNSPEQLELLRSYTNAIEGKTPSSVQQRQINQKIESEFKNGLELEGRGEMQEALLKFESVLTFDPQHKDAAEHIRRIKAEIEHRESEIRRRAEIADRLAHGKSLLEAQSYLEALTNFQKALALDPDNAEAQASIIKVEALLERQAREKERRRQRIGNLLARGSRLFHGSELEAAKACFDSVLVLEPGNSEALIASRRAGRLIEERTRADIRASMLEEAARLMEHDSLITARDLLIGARQLGQSRDADSLYELLENSLAESERRRRMRDLPQVLLNLPADSAVRFTKPTASLSGTAADDDGILRIAITLNGRERDVFLFAGNGPAPGSQSFEENLDLAEGANRIELAVYDGEQNIAAISREVFYWPPFWKTPLFAGLCSGLLLLGGGGYYYYRRNAIHILLNRLRRRPFELIAPNPFIVGNPIRSREMFFGREDDFRYVKNKVDNEKYGSLIILFGERRAGKTSVLYQIVGGRLGTNYLPVFIDMQAMAVNDDSEFLGRLAEITSEALRPQQIDFELSVFEDHSKNPYPLFEKFIDKVLAAAGEQKLLLLVDEYELIEDKVEEGKIKKDIFLFLSGLVEHKAGLFLIFAGNHRLQDRKKSYWEPLLQRCDYRNISYLTPNDTRRLIQEPVRGKVFYLGSSIRTIMRLTAGQPFYTQLICRNIVEMLNEEKRNSIFDEDFSAIIREINDNPPPQMIYFWAGLGAQEKSILSALAECCRSQNYFTGQEDIAAVMKKYSLSLSADQIKKVCENMVGREILESDSKEEYRFRMDLFRLWIREEHNLFKVSQEIERQLAV